MSTALLLIIYFCFIGLGIPDSLFGAAWPAIYTELDLPISYASIVSFLVSVGTVSASFLSGYLIRALGTRRITWISTAMTAAALLGFSFSHSMLWFCLLAVPLGLGAGAIDTALNNYVALHYNAMQMSFLHCFYGIGVSVSPYLLSFFLSGENADWRSGYRTMSAIQIAIAILALLSAPLWKVHESPSVKEDSSGADASASSGEENAPVISPLKLLMMPKVRAVCLVFFGSCAVEHIAGVWGATYLVNSRGLGADMAARVVTLYYAGIALGRLLSGLLSNRLTAWQVIIYGECLTAGAIALLLVRLVLPLPVLCDGIALLLIGIGNGAFFPNMIHLTPDTFGRELSQSVIGTQMGSAYLGIMTMPPLFGVLAQTVSTELFAPMLAVMFCVMVLATRRVLALNQKHG